MFLDRHYVSFLHEKSCFAKSDNFRFFILRWSILLSKNGDLVFIIDYLFLECFLNLNSIRTVSFRSFRLFKQRWRTIFPRPSYFPFGLKAQTFILSYIFSCFFTRSLTAFSLDCTSMFTTTFADIALFCICEYDKN